MKNRVIPILFCAITLMQASGACWFGSKKASIYLGPNYSVAPPSQNNMLEIKIGDYGPYKFPEDAYGFVKIAKKFKVSEEYTVQVFNDGVQIQSWNLDFSNYEDQDVQIWRDKGAWLMNKKSDEL